MNKDKSKIETPYLCKQETRIAIHDEQLKQLISINQELKDNLIKLTEINNRINNLEDNIQSLQNKLWYIAGGTILALIGAIIQTIL